MAVSSPRPQEPGYSGISTSAFKIQYDKTLMFFQVLKQNKTKQKNEQLYQVKMQPQFSSIQFNKGFIAITHVTQTSNRATKCQTVHLQETCKI